MKVRIIFNYYVTPEGIPIIGGIETYITNLLKLCSDLHIEVSVYQYGKENYEYRHGTAKIIAVNSANTPAKLLKFIDCENPDYENDLLLFATDYLLVANKFKRTIAIQHGIAWDIPAAQPVSHFRNIIEIFVNALKTVVKSKRYQCCSQLVCVDYNFVNWYRAQVAYVNTKLYVIPNFSEIIPWSEKKEKKTLSIVFARRLVEYRGTRLFAQAIKQVKKSYPNIAVTIAGKGPEEEWMRSYLSECSNIIFTSYQSDKSLQFHSQFDIAVVPTKGSEGTSLSLLEAMSAGCAVIATNVGGMTNIVINEYNGMLINPEVDTLTEALLTLIEDEEKRKRLAKAGNETVRRGFSLEHWRELWKKVLLSDGETNEK